MCFLQPFPDKKTTTSFLAALSCLASRSKPCYPMCFKISSLFTRRVVKLHLPALLVWFPACHVPPPPCSYSKILSSFFLQPHLTHVVGLCVFAAAELQWDCPRGQAPGWAGWSMQHMLKWDFLSISDCCWGCVAQQGYLRTQILLYITELSILCAEVGLGCCINRLFHIKHHSLPFSKMKLLSLLAPAFLFWWWVCWNFLPIDINKSVWWCNWNNHSVPIDYKHLVNQVVLCWIRCSVYNARSWRE